MGFKLHKLALLVSVVCFWGHTQSVSATEFGPLPWEDLIGKSELVVWVQLTKWERIDHTCTFEIWKTYRGPKLQTLTVRFPNTRLLSGPFKVNESGILFLKKEGDEWVPAELHSWWPFEYVITTDLESRIRVLVPDEFVVNLPEPIKLTKLQLKQHLYQRMFHDYEVENYLKEDVDAWLDKHAK